MTVLIDSCPSGVLPNSHAICLLSGGLDSVTVLHCVDHYPGIQSITAVSFNYSQRHSCELECAAFQVRQCRKVERHLFFDTPMPSAAASALTNADVPLRRNCLGNEMADGIPASYVPGRNIIFLSLAASLADMPDNPADVIALGVNQLDYSGYPDCRGEFLHSFQAAIRAGTRRSQLQIWAPLLYRSKVDIIRLGLSLGVDYGMTSSCYSPNEKGQACGTCDSCVLRQAAFKTLGMVDPRQYVTG